MWSSSAGLTPFMSYIIHFVDKDWYLQSLSLGTHFVPEDHTSPILAEAMKATLQKWELESIRQVASTTDNGANIVAAAEQLSWTRVFCFGHNLHLAITKALENDSRCSWAISLAHKIVRVFTVSWKKAQIAYYCTQQSLNLPKHTLISDCRTRWGITLKMLTHLLEQEPAVWLVLSIDKKASHLVPTWHDTGLEINQCCLSTTGWFYRHDVR